MGAINLFDYFEEVPLQAGEPVRWAAWAPRRPNSRFDLKLVPRSEGWREDPDSLEVLERIEAEPWVNTVARTSKGASLRLDDDWIEATGNAVRAGEAPLADLAHGRRFSVQFWDANATKALHVGHLRNLAIGNALAASFAQAGAEAERRSLISDIGRSMGEAMAGVLNSRQHEHSWPDGNEKSDHFVGLCYAEYVAASGSFTGAEIEHPEDSMTRELTMRQDTADELLKSFLAGESEAVELWYKTRAWVIAGQRKTLARLGISFDRVFFESDFLADAAELTASGLSEGRLKRREDGVVVYATGLEDFEEFPLVRADGVPTQHMRSLVYWMAAPELDGMTSMQVCGTEWVSHVTCRRKLMHELTPGERDIHPTHDIFNGMVSRQKRAVTSSEGALLIDELTDWLDAEIDGDPARLEVRRQHPAPERIAAQIALGYFLPYPVAPSVDFDPAKLLQEGESLGWDLARARARHTAVEAPAGRPAADPGYRFAVVQSELHRRNLRLAVDRLDVGPLARYLKHLAHWYLEADHGPHVEEIVQTAFGDSARSLGLEAQP